MSGKILSWYKVFTQVLMTEVMHRYNDDKALADWTRSLALALGTGARGKNEMADLMIDEREGFLEKDKSRKKGPHSDVNGNPRNSTDGNGNLRNSESTVMLCNGIPSSVLTPKVHKRNTVPARENSMQEMVDAIWSHAPAMSRQRSSKPNLLKAILGAKPKIDVAQLPAIINGLRAWVESDKWTKDNGQYQEGIHRWVSGRQWETPPQRPETWQEKFERETRELGAMWEVQP